MANQCALSDDGSMTKPPKSQKKQAKKTRVDQLLVERELVESRTRAQALIMAGTVFSGETKIDKPGQQLASDAPLEVRGRDHPYVSRGGVKLAGALDAFALDPAGLVVADFGASTGGFTDCVLQRGATKVYAIDVGYGQLHNKLRQDPRVVVMERTNARHLDAESLPEPVDLVVIDASFISLAKLLDAAIAVLAEGGAIVGMIKPQFEVGQHKTVKGVVRDPVLREQAIQKVITDAEARGLRLRARAESQLAGPKGNVEAFVWLERA